MSKLIIVCGLPGSGKTTLAKEISKKLNIFSLHKDSIKENLYDIEGRNTLDHSRELGIRSYKLQIRLAEEQIANNVDLIIESPFMFLEDQELFQKWINQYKVDAYAIICQIDNQERINRLKTRSRHKAHHDHERNIEELNQPDNFYQTMPGKQLWISTDKPVSKLVDKIFSEFNF